MTEPQLLNVKLSIFFASHAAFSLCGQTLVDYRSLIGMAALHFDNYLKIHAFLCRLECLVANSFAVISFVLIPSVVLGSSHEFN
ncbi:hypothetical protein SLEP1_g25539 [Rubroshorea leprosula]|uniref:Uncharacterized protein n=1 Tax=Rubroshorea leprosula TaxID=152421 RepID=A0AAV5JJE1_9ROSI|nr:hypothetical protein SLEP1_g25539 [Rubroshorea leprosula]